MSLIWFSFSYASYVLHTSTQWQYLIIQCTVLPVATESMRSCFFWLNARNKFHKMIFGFSSTSNMKRMFNYCKLKKNTDCDITLITVNLVPKIDMRIVLLLSTLCLGQASLAPHLSYITPVFLKPFELVPLTHFLYFSLYFFNTYPQHHSKHL